MQALAKSTSRYRHRRRLTKIFIGILALICLGVGIYILVLITTPQITMSPQMAVWNTPVNYGPRIKENRLYIPRLKVNITYKAGGPEVLDHNAWHRQAERGNPQKGGNFILAAHRFEMGFTPGETNRKSPFYHIDKVEVGDFIYADYQGKRYQYKLTKKYSATANQLEVEAPSDTAKMTLYTCTLQGQAEGREVLEAKLVKKSVPSAKELVVH